MTSQQEGQGKDHSNHHFLDDSREQFDDTYGEFLQIGCSFINNLLSATYQMCITNEKTPFVTPEWFRDLHISYKEKCNEKAVEPGFFYKAITNILITLTERFDKESAVQILKQALRSTSLEMPGKTSILREQFNTKMYE